jgi:hypothetical protein
LILVPGERLKALVANNVFYIRPPQFAEEVGCDFKGDPVGYDVVVCFFFLYFDFLSFSVHVESVSKTD